MAEERKIDLIDDDLEEFHNTLIKLMDYHKKHEPQAFMTISAISELQDSIPWNVKDLTDV
jgi:hypothetical protein